VRLSAKILDATDTPVLAMSSVRAPFRPVQYLGNKLRALEPIVSAAEELIGQQGRVTDLFSGSSVVSQAFSNRGYQVTAVDSQDYARVLATAMLGVGRQPGEQCPSNLVLATAAKVRLSSQFARWQMYSDDETNAIESGDAAHLEELGRSLPLAWRNPRDPNYHLVRNGDGKCAFNRLPLIAAIYSGSYFGVRQAIDIDCLRNAAETLHDLREISDWQYYAILTAIMCSASAAAHSAGKHFAQPLNAGSSNNGVFLRKRLLDDRSVSVEEVFLNACLAIDACASGPGNLNVAIRGLAEDVIFRNPPPNLYYLDPPYTAQQYSRFYHVLETLCEYKIHPLLHCGKLTSGLYPTNRFKSAFSSRVKSASAFQIILKQAHNNRAALLISYSRSENGSTGNARMISLERLIEECRQCYGATRVELFSLRHRYRQFNSAALSNVHRDDPEILIVCRP
jgi:adenine-specific DNA methylase